MNAIEYTDPWYGFKLAITVQLETFHSIIVKSISPEAKIFESGENTAIFTALKCPFKALTDFYKVYKSHI